MENRNGINVGHLLQLQRDLTAAIDAARRESATQMNERLDQIQASLVEVKQKQDIANGRTSKLERGQAILRARIEGSSVLGSLSRAQKAKLTAAAVLLGGGLLETLHQILPKLVQLLGGPPPPTP